MSKKVCLASMFPIEIIVSINSTTGPVMWVCETIVGNARDIGQQEQIVKPKLISFVLIVISCTSSGSTTKYNDIAVPRKQLEQVCHVTEHFTAVENNEIHLVSGQLATFADCLYWRGEKEEAMKYWLLAGEHHSIYGLETAARIRFVQAKSASDMLETLSLFKLLGALDKSKRPVYHIYKGLSYLGDRFLEKDIPFLLVHFRKAVEMGSIEAALILVYLYDTGMITVEKADKGKTFWLQEARKIDPETNYESFVEFAMLSHGYTFVKTKQ